MTHSRRILSAVSALLIAAVMTGCGGGGSTLSSAPPVSGTPAPPVVNGPGDAVVGIAPPSGVSVVTANNAN